MSDNSNSAEGNLIHLNGPGLIPSKLLNNFTGMIESGSAVEDKKELFRKRFQNDYNQYPAYLWESNGEAFSFFIYKERKKKVDILWCHQLKSLFPVEIFFRPAMEALIEAFADDVGASKITSQFSSWSSIVGIDLLSSVCPELGFRRFDMYILNYLFKADVDLAVYNLPLGLTCTHWDIERNEEVAELMIQVGDSYIKYIDLQPEDCMEYIEKVFDPGLSRIVLNSENEIVSFINFNRQGWIGQIFTRADYQGKGIGKYLMSLALKELKDKKVNKSSLAVLADNQRAINLYEQFGFEYSSSSPIWALKISDI